MINIVPIDPRLETFLQKHNLQKKYAKQIGLLSLNPRHPSLHVELLEPKADRIYSFRIDRKYRALFFFYPEKQAIEIIAITLHYQ